MGVPAASYGQVAVFTKVLVANRGEIACRILDTLRRLGIASVAVYTDADAGSLHVRQADEAVRLGEGPVATSYLDVEKVLGAALATGADALHPGYGFLSESAAFATACGAAGVTWIGPSAAHLRDFGDKHRARELARAAGLPLLAGTGVLGSVAEALAAARDVGYPVMLKATAGGGGIGMQHCDTPAALEAAYPSVGRLAKEHFGSAALYLERHVAAARHVEVQIFGARGEVGVLGLRDCSAQRRHQKVIEETPPPNLGAGLGRRLERWANRLGTSVGYRSAGTVEFVVDVAGGEAAFLEVNTRLQVEHGITELITGVDLVEWMVLDADGSLSDLGARVEEARARTGATAIEARVYAEDPAHDNRPGTGTLAHVAFPPGARVDTWVETGTEVTPWYDPLLAKVLVSGPDRDAARNAMAAALADLRMDGVATNVGLLAQALADPRFVAGAYTTSLLSDMTLPTPTIEVLEPGMQTTVQDWPGRPGYWAVGVPPSGPMDDRSFRLANELVGNPPGAAGLEITRTGPTLRFETDATIALGGADVGATLDGEPVPRWSAIAVPAGGVLRSGAVRGPGARAYLCVRGGIDVPEYLGSRSTFILGGFGGHAGRPLEPGDVLAVAPSSGLVAVEPDDPLAKSSMVPALGKEWEIGVLDGPHGAPDFFTPEGIEELYAARWEVHHHSDRTGVRLLGPVPRWARPDGGEGGRALEAGAADRRGPGQLRPP